MKNGDAASMVERLKLFQGKKIDVEKQEQSNVIRIFLSSTFSDMVAERNLLLEKAYPALRSFCQGMGLDFQIIDLRWGIQDNATVDHSIGDLCLMEIKECKRLSLGPFFVAFVGNRYGYRPIPVRIDVKVFNKFIQIASNTDITGAGLLQEWYRRDDNTVPPTYILQPITSKYSHFDDQDTLNEHKRNEDVKNWTETFQGISNVIRRCAKEATLQNFFNGIEGKVFYKSVTEMEIEEGLNNVVSSESTLIYQREITDIEKHLGEATAQTYIDMKTPGKVDSEAQTLLKAMKNEIGDTTEKTNVKIYQVEWSRNQGISKHINSHATYLQSFCDDFVTDLRRSIIQSIKLRSRKREKSDKEAAADMAEKIDWVFEEVHHQASFAYAKRQSFCGRKLLIDSIISKLFKEDNNNPLVIYGSSGKGKSALIAKLIEHCHVSKSSNILVYRFLGTSPSSSHIHDVLQALVLQISVAFQFPVPALHCLQSFNDISQRFIKLLDEVSKKLLTEASKEEIHLVIFLDSLDQLSPIDGAHRLNWLPKQLPLKVRIVLSTIPDPKYGIFKVLSRSLPKANFMEVKDLDEATGKEILGIWLSNERRSLTNPQHKLIMDAFNRSSQPLFLKLAFDEARRWKSYTNVTNLKMAQDAREAISMFFKRLERKHGKVFVSHAIGYLVAIKNGITESELNDLLSLDDLVLDCSYRHWSPPTSSVVRVPAFLWTRLRFDLGDYLVERQAAGHTVLVLYHRQFTEVAHERYLKGDMHQYIHSNISEYFLGIWSDGKRKELKMNIWKNKVYAVDRKVASQPIKFDGRIFNYRKLDLLPYHLLQANKWPQLCNIVLSSATWMQSKIDAYSIKDVLQDYKMIVEEKKSTEVFLIAGALKLAKPTLEFQELSITPGDHSHAVDGGITNHLFLELYGRLEYFKDDFPTIIGKLVKECSHLLRLHQQPTLLPLSGCFQPPGGPLRATLTGFQNPVTCMVMSTDGLIMAAGSTKGVVLVWEVGTDEVLYAVEAHKLNITCMAISGMRLASGSLDNSLYVMNLDNGSKVAVITETRSKYVTNATLALSNDGNMLVSGCGTTINIWNISNQHCILSIQDENTINLSCKILLLRDERIIAGYENGTIKCWSIPEGKELYCKSNSILEKSEPAQEKNYVIANYIRDEVLISCWRNGVVTFSLESSGLHLTTLKLEAPEKTAISPNGEFLALSCGNKVHVWCCKDKLAKRLGVLRHHHNSITAMEFDTMNQTLVIGSTDEEITVWPIKNHPFGNSLHPNLIIKGMGAPVDFLCLCGNIIASASKKVFYIKLWNSQKNGIINEPLMFPFNVRNNAISPCGQYLAIADNLTADITFYDLHSRQYAKSASTSLFQLSPNSLMHDSELLTSLIFTSSSENVLCATSSGKICKIKNPLISKRPPNNLQHKYVNLCSPDYSGPVIDMSLSRDGIRVLAYMRDDTFDWIHLVHCFEMLVENSISTKALQLEGRVTVLCLGNESKQSIRCFVGTDQCLIYILQLCEIKDNGIFSFKCGVEAILTLHQSPLTSLRLSHDQTTLFSGSKGRTRRLWKWKENEWKLHREIFFDSLLPSGVTSAAFSKDDKFIISGSHERSIKVWDAVTGAVIATQYVYSSVTGITMTDDSRIIATTKMGFILVNSLFFGKEDKNINMTTAKNSQIVRSTNRKHGSSKNSTICKLL